MKRTKVTIVTCLMLLLMTSLLYRYFSTERKYIITTDAYISNNGNIMHHSANLLITNTNHEETRGLLSLDLNNYHSRGCGSSDVKDIIIQEMELYVYVNRVKLCQDPGYWLLLKSSETFNESETWNTHYFDEDETDDKLYSVIGLGCRSYGWVSFSFNLTLDNPIKYFSITTRQGAQVSIDSTKSQNKPYVVMGSNYYIGHGQEHVIQDKAMSEVTKHISGTISEGDPIEMNPISSNPN